MPAANLPRTGVAVPENAAGPCACRPWRLSIPRFCFIEMAWPVLALDFDSAEHVELIVSSTRKQVGKHGA